MSVPFDILQHFGCEEHEIAFHEVFFWGEWEGVPGGVTMDSTQLVVMYQRGVTRIAVKYEDRVVEFDLRGVILRDGSMNPVER